MKNNFFSTKAFLGWLNELLPSRDIYSKIILFLVVLGELFALTGLRTENWNVWLPWTLLAVFVAYVIWLLSRFAQHRFNMKSLILTKLLANAITPRPLGIWYLLFFVVHIGWLTNAMMSLFTPTDGLSDVVIAIAVCIAGMIAIICFFPEGNIQKNPYPIKVFVSGISFIGSAPATYDKLNLIPLVRILQSVEESDKPCKMVILLSDAFKDGNVKTAEMLRNVMEKVNDQRCNDLDQCITIRQKLEMLIREVAKREFVDRPWLDEKLSIEFTSPCNYNVNFESAFKILEPIVTEMDDENHQLYLNCTPGTSTIGALMTLLAIDGDRKLFYYSQEDVSADLPETEKLALRDNLIKEIDKTKIPLYSLLSQALDKFEKKM